MEADDLVVRRRAADGNERFMAALIRNMDA
jgi:hypothetical protein